MQVQNHRIHMSAHMDSLPPPGPTSRIWAPRLSQPAYLPCLQDCSRCEANTIPVTTCIFKSFAKDLYKPWPLLSCTFRYHRVRKHAGSHLKVVGPWTHRKEIMFLINHARTHGPPHLDDGKGVEKTRHAGLDVCSWKTVCLRWSWNLAVCSRNMDNVKVRLINPLSIKLRSPRFGLINPPWIKFRKALFQKF